VGRGLIGFVVTTAVPTGTVLQARLGYRLVRAAPTGARRIVLDAHQRAVVEHRGGSLLVLAGPGTGKTTTLVELVADRVERGELRPDQVLVLTFSRRAADELRVRLGARLARTVRGRLAWTFHSWCLALVRQHDPSFEGAVPRLLSGPEQDVVVRQLLAGDADGPGAERWPADLRPVLRTRGFAAEVRELLARCQERGIDPPELHRIGSVTGRPAWRSVASFYAEYLDNLGWQGALDYAGLVRHAAGLLAQPEVLAAVLREVRLVVVDEYQDTDPAQEHVLRTLAAGGAELVVVGDPDQAIYAFRGADVSGILEFAARFAGFSRQPVRTLALQGCRRSGPGLVAASRSAVSRVPLPRLGRAAASAHRALAALGPQDSAAEVRLFASPAQEAAAVADLLRRAHLRGGLAWSEMAVLVRTTRLAAPLLRALADAGVPVETPIDEVPLAREPALTPLLTLLRAAVEPNRLDSEAVHGLLVSPLGGADALVVRQLRRTLRDADRSAGGQRRSDALLVELLRDERQIALLPERVRSAPQRLAHMLAGVRRVLGRGGSVEDTLWAAWSASRWRAELEHAVVDPAAPPAAVRHAHRQLDAIVGLFDAAARFTDRLPGAGLEVFLDELVAQEIPADPLSQRPMPREAVRLLTAHRSKGLEWDLVVVAGGQEAVWPDLRRRGSVLGSGELAPVAAAVSAGSPPPGLDEIVAADRAAALADERRLFYVAATRARRRLVCTAVAADDELGVRPSRLLDELGVRVPDEPEQPPRVLSMPALVAELRRVAVDPQQPAALREAAAARLAALAPVEPAASPDSWWGLRNWTQRSEPLVPVGEPVRLSPSQVESIQRCPLQWFLRRRAGVESVASTSQGFGTLVHALARVVVDTGTLDLPDLERRLDELWPQLDWEAPWYARTERQVASGALARFAAYHRAAGRAVEGVEVDFTLRACGAEVRGQIDRVERDEAGCGVVIDLKTGRSKARRDELPQHPQLGLYQLAVAENAIEQHSFTGTGGAALLQLRKGGGDPAQWQPPLEVRPDGGTWVHDLLHQLVQQVTTETFPARRNEACSSCEVRRSCPAQPAGGQVV